MKAPGLVLAAAVAVLGTATGAAQVFRAGTDVVYLSITVIGPDGRLVGGLDQTQFQIYEDGVPQTPQIFSRDPQPIALSILLDTSTSMEPRLHTALEAASGFISRLTSLDVAQIIQFDSQVQVLQPFTSDRALLQAAIRRAVAGGSTSLFNAVYVALSEQRKVKPTSEEDLRRQAIVVLSDGDDTSSLVDYDQVLDQAKRSEVVVYAIDLRDPPRSSDQGFDQAGYVLRTLSEQTGGRLFVAERVTALADIYDQIALELANQYTIGYISTNKKRDGAWRTIRVTVTEPPATARTRAGYYGPVER